MKSYTARVAKPLKGFKKGFTLIEVLVVIAIIGVLAGSILIAIDPLDKFNAANDAKVQQDVYALSNAIEAYAVNNGGSYLRPGGQGGDLAQQDLISMGELKVEIKPPSGYVCEVAGNNYRIWTPSGSQAEVFCELKSKKYSATKWWLWCSLTGKAGNTTGVTTCPQ